MQSGNKEIEGIRAISRSALEVEVPENTNSAINIKTKNDLNIAEESLEDQNNKKALEGDGLPNRNEGLVRFVGQYEK